MADATIELTKEYASTDESNAEYRLEGEVITSATGKYVPLIWETGDGLGNYTCGATKNRNSVKATFNRTV